MLDLEHGDRTVYLNIYECSTCHIQRSFYTSKPQRINVRPCCKNCQLAGIQPTVSMVRKPKLCGYIKLGRE